MTTVFYVSPEYFKTMRIPVLQGRTFTRGDQTGSAPVAIVSEGFARKYLKGIDAVSRRIKFEGVAWEIAGIVGDVQQPGAFETDGVLGPVPAVYVPVSQTEDQLLRLVHTWFTPAWSIRMSSDPERSIEEIRRALKSVDPMLPIASIMPMEEVRGASTQSQQFQASLLGALAGLALLLSAVGIYGLIATSVVERTREIGIRVALGATLSQLVKTIALPGVVLAFAGVVLGGALAMWASRLLRFFVFGVAPQDPWTLAAVGGCLIVVACAASLIPALRAGRIDPATTLRAD
jgi:hypothetical protein